jgi:putative ABC transport system permease protein
MTRDGFAEHVKLESGGTGPGVWLPNRFAEQSGLKVGDPFTIVGYSQANTAGPAQAATNTTVPVAAIYTDLRRAPLDPYWCAHRVLYEGEPGQEFGNRPIAPLVLMDEPTFMDRALTVTAPQTRHDADYALADTRIDVARAADLAAGLDRMRQELQRDPLTSAGLTFLGYMPKYVPRTDLVRRSLVPPVVAITAAGVAVGLLVVAAAALFWVQRRRRELTVLAAHGVGPVPLGFKALLEALPALVAGAALGWWSALLLVRGVGPSPVLTDDARVRSVVAAAAALAAALTVAAVAAGMRSRWLTDVVTRHRRVKLFALPWELLLVAAGVAAWFLLDDSTERTSDGFGSVAQVPGRLLIVPILVIIGLAAFGGRLGTRWLRRRARRPGSPRPALFLAGRRLSREAAIAAMLAGATAVPIAFAAYGATVNGSVRATLQAEAGFMIGADVVVTLSEPAAVPSRLAKTTTAVTRVSGVIVGGVQTDILVVDPATFIRDSSWDDRPTGMDADEAMRIVRNGGAVGARPIRAGEQQLGYVGREFPAVNVTQVDALMASQGSYPTMLVSRETAGDLVGRGTPQLWIRGDAREIRQVLDAAGLPVSRIAVARDLYGDTVFEAVTYTFDYLAALSLLTGLITAVGLLLYLESRAPAHRRGYALLRRMRLRPGSHRAALAVELSAPLVAGLVGGTALAFAIVAVVSDEFEINTTLPPGTVVAVPYAALAATAAAVAVIALLAIGYAQRRVGRATPAEVLREVA